MAVECSGNQVGSQPIPAAGDHVGVSNPIGEGMNAVSELPDLALFERVRERA